MRQSKLHVDMEVPTLLWAFPTPQTILAMKSHQELSHPLHNCESQTVNEVSELESHAKFIGCQTEDFLSLNEHIGPPECNHYCTNLYVNKLSI